jgi:protein-S-isoprenylcysteine O-methyltransferase Ste14
MREFFDLPGEEGKMTAKDPTVQMKTARGGGWIRGLVLLVIALLTFGAPFIGAGTLAWPAAWAWLVVTLAGVLISRVLMARANPDLVAERSASVSNEGTKGWDRLLMPLIGIVGPVAIGLVAGLNYRFTWPPDVSLAVQVLGLPALLLGLGFSTWAMVSNRYFSSVVRIQSERGHQVISSGPYSFVRHPGYAAAVLGEFGTALMLGSAWALVPVALLSALYVLRTALEDRTLQAELPGYRDYAGRVRYRLLPGVW